MKNIIKTFVLYLLVISTLNSCEKDDVQSLSCKIETSTQDGVLTNFAYNDNGSFRGLSQSSNDFNLSTDYNDQGYLKRIVIFNGSETVDVHYSLNSDGLPYESTIISTDSENSITLSFYYSGANLARTILTSSEDPNYDVVSDYYYTNGNVTKIIKSAGMSGDYNPVSKYTYNYDNKPNPYYNLGLKYFYFDDSNFAGMASKNNITEIIAVYDNGNGDPIPINDESDIIYYEYNEDDYPIEQTSTLTGVITTTYDCN